MKVKQPRGAQMKIRYIDSLYTKVQYSPMYFLRKQNGLFDKYAIVDALFFVIRSSSPYAVHLPAAENWNYYKFQHRIPSKLQKHSTIDKWIKKNRNL